MLSAGVYKFTAGYRRELRHGVRHGESGMGLLVAASGDRSGPSAWWFRLFNELAWSTEVIGALSMLVPPTRNLGAMFILVSFVFIATQIRLGFLCEMVMVCCLIFRAPRQRRSTSG